MITSNEKKILKYLLVNFNRDGSINQIAKECKLSPNGAYKIFKKLEKEEIVKKNKIANLISYKINFTEKSRRILELSFMEQFSGKFQQRYNDLLPLREVTDVAVIFGSYLQKSNSHDLDILFIVKKSSFKRYKVLLQEQQEIIPLPIHDIVQTKEDFIDHFKDNAVLKEAVSSGLVLWGHSLLVEVIENAWKR